jgi:hypothetical protein
VLSWQSRLSRRICIAGRIDVLVPPGLTDCRQIAVAVPSNAEGDRIAMQQLTASLDAPPAFREWQGVLPRRTRIYKRCPIRVPNGPGTEIHGPRMLDQYRLTPRRPWARPCR